MVISNPEIILQFIFSGTRQSKRTSCENDTLKIIFFKRQKIINVFIFIIPMVCVLR